MGKAGVRAYGFHPQGSLRARSQLRHPSQHWTNDPGGPSNRWHHRRNTPTPTGTGSGSAGQTR
jgi:hypothetical protein